MSKAVLILAGFAFGIFTAAAVSLVLMAMNFVPGLMVRFQADRHRKSVRRACVFGILLGGLYGAYHVLLPVGALTLPGAPLFFRRVLFDLTIPVFGLVGIYVGCLAGATEEILGGISLLARRIRTRRGIRLAVLFLAIGKSVGAVISFFFL